MMIEAPPYGAARIPLYLVGELKLPTRDGDERLGYAGPQDQQRVEEWRMGRRTGPDIHTSASLIDLLDSAGRAQTGSGNGTIIRIPRKTRP